MSPQKIGLLVMGFGVICLVVGALLYAGLLHWFGRLPGDIRIENENSRLYVPLTSMLLLSVVLSLALHVWRRFFS